MKEAFDGGGDQPSLERFSNALQVGRTAAGLALSLTSPSSLQLVFAASQCLTRFVQEGKEGRWPTLPTPLSKLNQAKMRRCPKDNKW